MDKIIYHSVSLQCCSSEAFGLFTVGEHLERWLAEAADVEPRVGGKYELFWDLSDKENDSTIGCRILAISLNKFICFEWKGPKQFKHFMNNVRPLTNVLVFIIPSAEGTDVHLLHTGWRDNAEWEEARRWFDKAWVVALSKLQKYVEKRAQNYDKERRSSESV